MAIDPSIIGNVMVPAAPQLPDVNAMMQTRTAGMENIYTLERQRQADALAMQDRAAAQVKEQEAAIIKALLPAYTYGIQTGDIAGAGNLVPPEMRGQLQPYIDALAGKSPQEVQAALIGSLSSSEMGQDALAAIQRAQTAQIQQGQLDVSRGRLALDTEQAGKPEAMTPYQEAQIALEREKFAAEQEAAARQAEAGGVDPKVKLKLDQAYPQASRALQSATTKIDQDIEDVENLLKDTEGLTAITGGVYGAYAPNISAAANRAQALLDKIKAGAGFTALQEMRDASPTGGALGNVSNTEGQKLEDSVATFSQRQSLRDFQNGLRQYLIDLKTAKENVQSTFDETYSYRGEAPSVDIIESASERRKRIREETMPQTSPALPPGVTVKKKTPTQED